jgi:type II secretory pathway component GspD/PulD (secretin)
MRVLLAVAAGLFLSLSGAWAQAGAPAAPLHPQANPAHELCQGKNAAECGVSPQDFKRAREIFRHALKLKVSHPEQALSGFEEAARLVPRDIQYITARELMRQHLVYEDIQRGKELASQGRTVESATAFRKALELDPGNQFATQKLREIVNASFPPAPTFIETSPEEADTQLGPRPGQQTLHLIADTRGAYSQIGAAFGIKVTFDDSTLSRPVRLNLDKVDFAQAMNAVALVTHTFWTPVTSSEVMAAADTAAKRKELDRWLLRTFYLPQVNTPQELTDIVNLLRTLFELRFVTQAPANFTITVRGPAPVVQAATQFLQTLWARRPQVMLDFEVYQVTKQMMRAIGVDLPLQFNVFNIPQAVVSALNSGSLSQLLNQLNAAGGQANSSAIAALIAQLGLPASTQSELTALLQNPVATFGGGITLFGVPVPPATINFSQTDSLVTVLDKATLHAAQGNAATFRLGTRYPVLNASYSAFATIPGLTGSVSTFPSFTYEDLGLTIKAKPSIHADSVTLELEMAVKSLGSQVLNGIPLINNRSFKGVITVKDNEPAVVAGALSRNEQKTLKGIPGIYYLPIIGQATTNRTKEIDSDELLILIRPHVLSGPPENSAPIVIPAGY